MDSFKKKVLSISSTMSVQCKPEECRRCRSVSYAHSLLESVVYFGRTSLFVPSRSRMGPT